MAAPALYGRGEKLYEKFKHALVGQRVKKLNFFRTQFRAIEANASKRPFPIAHMVGLHFKKGA